MKTFVQRFMDVTFTLSSGSFKNGMNSLKLSGLRMAVTVKLTANASELKADIYGLSKDVMNRLLAVKETGAPWRNQVNNIRLETYTSDDATRFTLFNGQIIDALADFNDVPEVPLKVTASGTFQSQSVVLQNRSFKGAAKVSDIMKYLAGQIGAGFDNVNVDDSFILRDHTVQGSAVACIEATAKAANINWLLETVGTQQADLGGTLVICKKGTTRKDAVMEIHEANGLMGYPVIHSGMVDVRCLFSPFYLPHKKVRLFSKEQDIANGDYYIAEIEHKLDSENPSNGDWESKLTLAYPFDEK